MTDRAKMPIYSLKKLPTRNPPQLKPSNASTVNWLLEIATFALKTQIISHKESWDLGPGLELEISYYILIKHVFIYDSYHNLQVCYLFPRDTPGECDEWGI